MSRRDPNFSSSGRDFLSKKNTISDQPNWLTLNLMRYPSPLTLFSLLNRKTLKDTNNMARKPNNEINLILLHRISNHELSVQMQQGLGHDS